MPVLTPRATKRVKESSSGPSSSSSGVNVNSKIPNTGNNQKGYDISQRQADLAELQERPFLSSDSAEVRRAYIDRGPRGQEAAKYGHGVPGTDLLKGIALRARNMSTTRNVSPPSS